MGWMNHFDINKLVAVAHIRAEQLKGLFLASAKLLLVLLSGAMLFLGVLLAVTNISFTHPMSWQQFLAALPLAFVTGLFAIAIEGGTLFSASFVKAREKKIKQELDVLAKAQTKYHYTAAELKEKQQQIKNQHWPPHIIMGVCVFFSVCGAEIFWQKLLEDQSVFFHAIGYVLGLVVSALLIFFEFNEDLIQRVIEQTISSSSLIMLALDQSAKSQIHNELFTQRRAHLKTPEFKAIIAEASEQSLYGVLEDAVGMAGLTVSAEQLQRNVTEEKESRAAAEAFIASGGNTEPLQIPLQNRGARANPNGRMTAQRRKCEAIVQKYGRSTILRDLDRYAQEAGVHRKTLERWLTTPEIA